MKINQIIRSTYYFIIFITLLTLGIALFFLYNNFYQTLSQARVVYVLKNQVSFEPVNIKLWEKVLLNLENKKKSNIGVDTLMTDPFIPFQEIKPQETKPIKK